tara:strand:+ start:20931 stop:21806 length:876 start_codon:yes stop_codon:yes gene_type:complete
MKTLLSFFLVTFLFIAFSHAQQQYTIDGKEYSLYTEVDGPLTLLWNSIDGEYRYFSKKDNEIVELKNTKSSKGYQEEYKAVLTQQTAGTTMNLPDVKLTLAGLRDFVVQYNKRVDPNYTYESKKVQLETRLGVFAGVTNTVYNINPDNTLLPVLGVDLELYDNDQLRRHAVVFRFKQTLGNSDYDFNASQLSLNYRFKFVATSTFDLFVNAKFVSYNYIKRDVDYISDTGQPATVSGSGGELQAPVAFGIGADVALLGGHLTFTYNDFVALGLESESEFPVDFSLGYKIGL